MASLVDIGTIRDANAALGHCWFDPGSMRFFKTRTAQYGYQLSDGRRVFVTSEQFTDGRYRAPRRYSIRIQAADGSVGTLGDFQAYGSRNGANAAMLRWIAQQESVAA